MLTKSLRKFSGNKLEEIFSNTIHHLPRETRKIRNKEALKLYREVLRLTKEFTWHDENNRLWAERIQASARQEFEMARNEKDPFIIGQMIVTSKEAIQKVREKLIEKYHRVNQEVLDGTFHTKNQERVMRYQRSQQMQQSQGESKMSFDTIIEK